VGLTTGMLETNLRLVFEIMLFRINGQVTCLTSIAIYWKKEQTTNFNLLLLFFFANMVDTTCSCYSWIYWTDRRNPGTW